MFSPQIPLLRIIRSLLIHSSLHTLDRMRCALLHWRSALTPALQCEHYTISIPIYVVEIIKAILCISWWSACVKQTTLNTRFSGLFSNDSVSAYMMNGIFSSFLYFWMFQSCLQGLAFRLHIRSCLCILFCVFLIYHAKRVDLWIVGRILIFYVHIC